MSNIKTAIEATFDANPNGFRDSIHAEIIDKIQAAIQAKKEEMAHSFLNFGEQQDNVVEDERFLDNEETNVAQVGEQAKWRSEKNRGKTWEPDETEDRDDGFESKYPIGNDTIDKLDAAQRVRKTVSAKDPKSLAAKYGTEYAKKYGDDTKEHIKRFRKQVGEEVEQIDETMTRKHFQLVANTVREIEDPKKRQELANHHAKIFAASNPRFDHARFHQACGTQIHEEVESIDEMEETPKHQREKTPDLPKTDKAAVEARKAREAAKERIEARKREKAVETGY